MPLDKLLKCGTIEVLHRVTPRNRHCYISIDRDGKVVLKSPRISDKEARRIVSEKSEWIERKLAEHASRLAPEPQLGCEIFYLGKMHRIVENPAFDDLGDAITRLRNGDDASLQRCYDRFYKRRAEDYIPERLQYFEKLCGKEASSIRFRKMRSRWGSCSSRGAITINTIVMQLPEALIDYIIVHELSHLSHMNHSRAFYAEVARILPEYRSLEKAIKTFRLL
jgi:hypothetical protein